jgi:hypothetical protein
MHAGAAVLASVLDSDNGNRGTTIGCGHGHQEVFAGHRPKIIDTVVGRIEMTRGYYYSAGCGHGLAPKDGDPGVHGSLSPGLAEIIALAGSQVPFAKASMLIARLAGIQLTVKRVERAPEASGRGRTKGRGRRGDGTAQPGPDPAAAAVPGPGHVLHRGRRDRDTGSARPRPPAAR